MNDADLAQRIRETAYLEGDFLLRSGKRSRYYLDKYRFETQPDILAELGKRLAARRSPRATLIAGAELGGVALAAAASMACGLPFVIVRNARKDYGTARPFEGIIQPDDVVLLVEDIATTGGQVLEAAKVLLAAGLKIDRIVAVVDRQEEARANIEAAGFTFEALYTAQSLGIHPPGSA